MVLTSKCDWLSSQMFLTGRFLGIKVQTYVFKLDVLIFKLSKNFNQKLCKFFGFVRVKNSCKNVFKTCLSEKLILENV